MNNKKNMFFLKIGLLSALALIYLLSGAVQQNVKQALFIMGNVDVGLVEGYILSFGILSPAVSFLLMIFQALVAPLNQFIIILANASIFGWAKGAVFSWLSVMAGASLCFGIAKFYARDAASRLANRFAIYGIDEFFEKYGRYVILIARLCPFMSFDMVSYASGLTSMSFRSFFCATGLGIFPSIIIYSYIGEMLTGGVKKVVFAFLILLSISILLFLFKKVWDDKNIQKKMKKEKKSV